MKTLFNLAALASLVVVGGAALAAAPATHGFVGQKLAAKAKVTMAQASAIALKAHPGRITDKELENEGGGSGLRYSFDIASGGKTFEVGVDAKTGAVLENKKEGKNPD
jgi:uncharacterized membrane protein YkoI